MAAAMAAMREAPLAEAGRWVGGCVGWAREINMRAGRGCGCGRARRGGGPGVMVGLMLDDVRLGIRDARGTSEREALVAGRGPSQPRSEGAWSLPPWRGEHCDWWQYGCNFPGWPQVAAQRWAARLASSVPRHGHHVHCRQHRGASAPARARGHPTAPNQGITQRRTGSHQNVPRMKYSSQGMPRCTRQNCGNCQPNPNLHHTRVTPHPRGHHSRTRASKNNCVGPYRDPSRAAHRRL